ncbi:MAG: patatin-like phospholipase family protein [Gammaproteobacteria bacterium]|nr:patatin-like phospholipase family protein [Gammaproteobacteria bacterium]MDH3561565.1 patatin-like phospholipase family protein [Gammaproteobacteria bacterium]
MASWRVNIEKSAFFLLLVLLLTACASMPVVLPVENPPVAAELKRIVMADRPVVAFALGGGAARGFAHAGVLNVLEQNGIRADIVVGTSAGSVAGALYAGGIRGESLIAAAAELQMKNLADWTLPNRGFIGGERLQALINDKLGNRPIEALDMVFVAVAADLQSGQAVAFNKGNTGMAVRASSSVPGIFMPVTIDGRDYVDGGLVSQLPVRIARELGADMVIAVDVSKRPVHNTVLETTWDVLHQALLIMSEAVVAAEAGEADVLIRPAIGGISLLGFDQQAEAIAAGERAVRAQLPEIRQMLDQQTRRKAKQ